MYDAQTSTPVAQPHEENSLMSLQVTPEDFFLGVDPLRHPGVSCSDAIVLKVSLPETKLADIDLDVRPTCVRLSAPKYKAKIQLSERVDEQKGARLPSVCMTMPVLDLTLCRGFQAMQSGTLTNTC